MQSQPTILILMGVTGSGKTTIGRLLCEESGREFFDADDFHPATNVEKMKRGVPLNDADREPWLLRLRKLISDGLERNGPAVLACSALKEHYRKQLLIDERVQLVYLQGHSDLIKKRLANRGDHYMNPTLVDSQFDTLEEPANCLRIDASAPPPEIVALIKKHFRL